MKHCQQLTLSLIVRTLVLFPAAAVASNGAHPGSETRTTPFDSQLTLAQHQTTQKNQMPCTPTQEQQQLLTLVNEARAQKRTCGNQSFPKAPALQWSCTLEATAKRHSDDMAKNDFMAHEGSDQSTPNERATAAGYSWRAVGENVAAGQRSPEAVMESWLNSPGHCSNIMRKTYAEMGAASTGNEQSKFKIFWTMMFGQPR